MINYKDLTCEQLQALAIMEEFDCVGITCDSCPLFSTEHGCGSQRAGNIIHQYEKETN